jgi:hypothetical protein
MPINKDELKALPTIARIESEATEFINLLDACVAAEPGLDAAERARLHRSIEDVRSAATGAVAVLSKASNG